MSASGQGRDSPGADGGRMNTSAIAVSGLRKAFGGKTVLDGIDLDVGEGTVFALLGPNGAGKTTTVNILTTLMKADGGTVRVAGQDAATAAKAVRKAIGVTGQFAAVDELLTGRENLQLMVDLSRRVSTKDGRRVVADLLERFGLRSVSCRNLIDHPCRNGCVCLGCREANRRHWYGCLGDHFLDLSIDNL
jgi:ABC-2 type transport system ATP-binding protein